MQAHPPVAWLTRTALLSLVVSGIAAAQSPTVELLVDRDDVLVTQSCRLRLVDRPVADTNGDGVVRIVTDGVTVEIAGTLRGAPATAAADTLTGIGIVVAAKNVTLVNGSVAGFKVGVLLDRADGARVERLDLSDNFAMRLGSTAAAEDGGDWLWPHSNDDGEWARNYGAGLPVRDSDNVVIRQVKARRTQNGILLERVENAKVLDNDCSFLSGWGIALWRSSRNTIARNAFDFCVRGYSHGVYNRGQDSAGILLFEQCSENLIALNSATHCGDGFFGFAGREALGEAPPPEGAAEGWHRNRGCNGNLIVANDFSFAVAHGIEMTFSSGNLLARNLLVGCGICGIWGGYSANTEIRENLFRGNGSAGYGGERGGVNIEHGRGNRVVGNRFEENPVAVRLWWDEDAHLAETPWAKASGVVCRDNLIAGNAFSGNELDIELIDASDTAIFGDCVIGEAAEGAAPARRDAFDETSRASLRLEGEIPASRDVLAPLRSIPGVGTGRPPAAEADRNELEPGDPLGDRMGELLAAVAEAFDPCTEVAARPGRPGLAGRERIVMTEWGPFAWDRVLLVVADDALATDRWRLLGPANGREPAIKGVTVFGGGSLRTRFSAADRWAEVFCERPGMVCPYRIEVLHDEGKPRGRGKEVAFGLIAPAVWSLRIAPSRVDPLADPSGWRAAMAVPEEEFLAAGGRLGEVTEIDFPFAMGGPRDLAALAEIVGDAEIGPDRFGIEARTTLAFPAGRFQIKVRSDDGVRLLANGSVLVERWDRHGPTEDVAELAFDAPTEVELLLEHFELDGYATLSLDIEAIETEAHRR